MARKKVDRKKKTAATSLKKEETTSKSKTNGKTKEPASRSHRPSAAATAKKKNVVVKHTKTNQTTIKKEIKKSRDQIKKERIERQLKEMDQAKKSQVNFRAKDRASELKFGCFEIVLAAKDLSATLPHEKYLVGRLEEDVWMGSDPNSDLMISWYNYNTDTKVWESEDAVDQLPVGSLVCSINKFAKEDVDEENYEILKIKDETAAFEYADKKLDEQLGEDYNSDDDSQFGDVAVSRRLAYSNISGVIKKQKMGSIKMEDDGDGGDDNVTGAKKKRKRASGGGAKKKARSLKGLTPRPNLAGSINKDGFLAKTGKIANFDGDVERTSKEVVRAVRSGDKKALKACLKSNKIADIWHYQSVALPFPPMILAIAQGDKEMVEIFLKELNDKDKPQRESFQNCSLPTLSTGEISGRHANYNRRQVGASRGGREGNNALLYDTSGTRYKMNGKYIRDNWFPNIIAKHTIDAHQWNLHRDFDELSDDILDLAEVKFDRTFMNNTGALDDMVRGGHRKNAERIIKAKAEHTFHANEFNFLHLESLGDEPSKETADPSKNPFSKDILARSVIKKAQTSSQFTPLACACINPNVIFLEALLTAAPEHAHTKDLKETTLVHYAAACEEPGPLSYLLETHSLSKTAIDKQKYTPLHFAARAARPKNIEVLLKDADDEQKKSMLSAKSVLGYAAIHYAVQTRRKDRIATLQALIDAGADVNMASTAARNKVMPVHIAAAMGDLDALKLLVKHGGKIIKGDKLGRTPLIHACINGQAHVVSYLLMEGASVETTDSSGNFPMHFAAAYGWLDCVKLLQAAGANPDAKNSWKTSPLSVAIQKGRHQISSHLLNLPQVDVNFRDDDGKTLFTKLAEAYISTTLMTSKEDGSDIEAIRKELPHDLQRLLERDDLDVTATDGEGRNLLHVLCELRTLSNDASTLSEQRAVALAKLVIEVAEKNKQTVASFDINLQDAEGMAPILHAAVNGNFGFFEFLLELGAKLDETIADKGGKNICHHLIGKKPHDCKDQLAFLEEKVDKETYLKLLSTPDSSGFNAVHRAFLFAVEDLSNPSDFEKAMNLLKDTLTENNDLAVIKVAETKCFNDPGQLAEIIVSTADEDNYMQSKRDRIWRLRNNRRNNGDKSSEEASDEILSEDDRVSPKKIKQALKQWKTAVPVTSIAYGKSLIHLACELKYPERMKAVFEWLVPLSKDVITERGGGYPDAKTPLELLMYDRMSGTLVSTVATDKRDELLVKFVDSIELLGEESFGGINVDAQRLFNSEKERVAHEKAYTKEMDEEAVKGVVRLATSFIRLKEKAATQNYGSNNMDVDNSDTDDIENVGQDLVEAFKDIMTKRLTRIKATSSSKSVREPITTMLARCGSSSIPVGIWKLLVEKFNINLERIDSNGDTALHISLRQNDKPLSKYLCEVKPGLTSQANNNGERPIHIAAKGDNPKLVRMLLDYVSNKKEEVNIVDKSGRTAYHYSVEMAAKRSGEHLDPCEIIFLRAGARLDVADFENRRTPLHYAFLESASSEHFDFPHCLSNDHHDRVDLVSSLLASEGADKAANLIDKQGRTPLFYAAAYNSTVSSLLLVSKGASLFDTDHDGNTPVNVAILRGHDSYAITMLKSMPIIPELADVVDIRRTKKEKDEEPGGREIVITSRRKKSIVWHAIKKNFRGLVYLLLDTKFSLYQAAVDAIELEAFQLVRKLFQTSPCEVLQRVAPSSGHSLLHCIAAVKQFTNAEWGTTLAEFLLSSAVSPSLICKDGQSALHIAAGNGHQDLIRKLVEADSTMLTVKDNDGHLPFGRFMRFLPNFSHGQTNDDCIDIFHSLTRDAELMRNDDFNQIPKSKADKTELVYEPNALTAGPNTKMVLDEIKKRQSEPKKESSEEDSLSSIIEGHSTVIIQALKAKKYEFAQEVIKQGASMEMADSDGFNPLHHAVLDCNIESVQLLLRNGADVDAKTENEQSITPLAIAIIANGNLGSSQQSRKMVGVLVQHGADVSVSCGLMKATALHFAIRENDLELVKLLLRAAQHSSCKLSSKKNFSRPNRLALVRFKGDCVLYPGVFSEESIQIFEPTKRRVPIERVAESFSTTDLELDSLRALQAMNMIINDNGIADQTTNQSISGELLNESDEDASDEDLSEGSDDSGDDMLMELEKEEAQEDNDQGTSDPNHKPIPEATLNKYYGVEALLVGATSKNLTKPILEGSSVIVQPSHSDTFYAKSKQVWVEGQIVKQWKNGTYDIDLFRGPVLSSIPRQLIRPWKKKAKLTWPLDESGASEMTKKVLTSADENGCTVMGLAVKPVSHGSYENIALVDELVKYGAAVEMDQLRPGSKFAKHLSFISGGSTMDISDHDVDGGEDVIESPPGLEPISSSELEKASQDALIILEKKGILQKKKSAPEILPVCETKAAGRRVLAVETNGGVEEDYFTVIMAKVETSHYGYQHSENKYYKMQVIEDPVKGLFVLVTNWGMVGDYGGQKQETPFSTRAEAEKEFAKIFKSKSGNPWDDYLAGSFEPKVGKYKPVKILPKNYEKPELPDIARMVACGDDGMDLMEEYKDVVKNSILSSELDETIKAFVNPKDMSSAANHLGLAQERLPLGMISVEMVLKAEEQLQKIEKALVLLENEKDLQKKRKCQDDVAVLSSGFFEMLPTKEGDKVLAPLDRKTFEEERKHIASLKDLTVASQIIKTAAVMSDKVNPLDYCYRAMNATMKPVDEDSPERRGVEQYFRNTANNDNLVINQVYHLRRNDEKSNKSMDNRRLLWHGTHVCNMMGVIKEGLRVAPSTAQIAGNAFGDGVYFADMVSKSWHYCRANFDSDAKVMPKAYMFLADVALGKQDKVTLPNWGDSPAAPDVDSVWAIGYEGPDVEKDFVFARQGTVFPLGPVCRSPTFEQRSIWKRGYRHLPKEMIGAIEKARTDKESEFPVTVRTQDGDKKPVDVTLSYGKGTYEAIVRSVKEKKKKTRIAMEDGENNDNAEDGSEDEEDEPYQEKEYGITRKTESLGSHIQHNEYVVMNPDRINLRYIVEVTSRQWLENQATKKS
ncbi:unnamed protein product [Cylindrotheca closterium]|uniref:Poly [ADP-ribose] polymerase n=1 Tax=Cylindrotheca closterium TaxID=2856 RepID=A0AAD2FPW3_9STRA|nr:unnamed protein product [Cylindrotheca closterium]